MSLKIILWIKFCLSVFADRVRSWWRDLRSQCALWRSGNNWCTTCCSSYNPQYYIHNVVHIIYALHFTQRLIIYATHWAPTGTLTLTRTLTVTLTLSQPCISPARPEIHRDETSVTKIVRHIDAQARSRDLANLAWLQPIRLRCAYTIFVVLYTTMCIQYKCY